MRCTLCEGLFANCYNGKKSKSKFYSRQTDFHVCTVSLRLPFCKKKKGKKQMVREASDGEPLAQALLKPALPTRLEVQRSSVGKEERHRLAALKQHTRKGSTPVCR
jgi:hypothetical protein